MLQTTDWREELAEVVDLMRNLSLQTDPQAAALMYGAGLRRMGLAPSDVYLSVSRRGQEKPGYRITRNSRWKEPVNPWKEPGKLPLLRGGLLAELIYSNEPAVIEDLDRRLTADDPAAEVLAGMKSLVSLPHFENGESLNMGVLLSKEEMKFPKERVPLMVWEANLWGRATSNLVTRQKLELAYAEMDRELKLVADIQRSLLPPKLPAIPGVDVAAHYQTSQRAGGDYYDFFPLPDGRWGIFMADVSGHGTPAAVMMAITHAIAHTRPGHPMPPCELLAYLNRTLAGRYTVDNGTFVTAFYGVLDARARQFAYASAGHPPPRLIRANKVFPVDGDTGLPLGVFTNEIYPEHEVALEPGDCVLLYTDGVPDAFDPSGTAFGMERLDAVCCHGTGASSDKLIKHILAAVEGFAAGAAVTDDRTLVALALY